MTTTVSDRRLAGLVVLVLGALLVFPLLMMTVGMFTGGMGGGMWGGGMWGGGMHGDGMYGDGMRGGGMYGGGAGPGWLWGLGFVIPLAFLGVVGALGYLLVRSAGTDGADDPAVEELRQTYARGELTDEEFERRLERLREE